jgi:excisionase family DNA binding protein
MALRLETLLTPAEAAAILQVSVGTLSVWRCVKRYPLKYIKVGHSVRYRETDLREFLRSREVAA